MCKTRKATFPKGSPCSSSLFDIHGKIPLGPGKLSTNTFICLTAQTCGPQSWGSLFPLANEANLVTHLVFRIELGQKTGFSTPPYNVTKKRLRLSFILNENVWFQKNKQQQKTKAKKKTQILEREASYHTTLSNLNLEQLKLALHKV